MSLPTITLEEHFLSTSLGEKQGLKARYFQRNPDLVHALEDLSPSGQRLQEMDAGHVTLQIISHAPGASSSQPSLCRGANDELRAAIAACPGRLAGFACLPMAHPDDAAAELERCVKELGFVGALIDNHTQEGMYYDGEEYWGVFEKAQELDVPLYIHPTFPTEEVARLLYKGNYNAQIEGVLGAAGWGWHQDTGLHVLRLFAAGVFDRFPTLKIIIGHMGEMLPFQLERCNKMTGAALTQKNQNSESQQETKSLKEVWDTNIWVTTSGMFSTNPMACMLRNTRIERILYSVDWPFAKNEAGWAFLEELRDSGLLKEGELEMIASGNAEALLGVKAKR